MSLPSNNDANQDINGDLSKVECEGQSTTLTEKVDKGDKKASFFSSLTKNWIVQFLFNLLKWMLGWIIYFPEERTAKFRDISVQTDDIIQKCCDCNKEVGKGEQKDASIISSLTETSIVKFLLNLLRLILGVNYIPRDHVIKFSNIKSVHCEIYVAILVCWLKTVSSFF